MRTRLRVSLTIAAALSLLATLALAGTVAAAETTLTAQMAGDAETDEDGTGTATVVLDPEAGTACWNITLENVDPITVSHIHAGAAGENGPVVVDLDLDGFDGMSEGCNEGVDAAALQSVIDDPASFYVNVHTEEFPAGAIRGQLAAATQPDTALPVTDGSTTLLGALLLLSAAGLAFRAWHPLVSRD